MAFHVTYPIGSTFAPNGSDPDAEPIEVFDDEDAYVFLPGGVLGLWSEKGGRSFYLPEGQWVGLSAKRGHRPGRRTVNGDEADASELIPAPIS